MTLWQKIKYAMTAPVPQPREPTPYDRISWREVQDLFKWVDSEGYRGADMAMVVCDFIANKYLCDVGDAPMQSAAREALLRLQEERA